MTEEELLEKIKLHKNSYDYEKARILVENYKSEKTASILRAYAESIYKDLELPKEYSYDKALEVLNEIQNDDNLQETLSLKGAVLKRKWEFTQNIKYLIKSKDFYKQAYEIETNNSYYSGINTAYLLDELANVIKSYDENSANIFIEEAKSIRINIIKNFKDVDNKDEWLLHTLAHAYFGLKKFDESQACLEDAAKLDVADWQKFTTFKQIKELADLKEIKDLDCLLPLVGEENKHILNYNGYKIGLALSGGGFRASLFHLGTLAKLAELDLLRHIEIISTVSGGSIIGTLYYLKLQQLLEKYDDKDNELTRDKYIELVENLIKEFLDVIQNKNIRNDVFKSHLGKTIKFMIPGIDYSRTNRLGEIYQEEFYKNYQQSMDQLLIKPKGIKNIFKPRFDNWKRKHKVPILVINSTNLNSGHNWQFHATKMGEPNYVTNKEIDKNDRFAWVEYKDKNLTNKFKHYSIGQAVASSSAVPAIFTPIILKNLYNEYELSISDGGVYDNQGFNGLLTEECNFILCSDASGQMDNEITSSSFIHKVAFRSNDILMDRTRELSFEKVEEMKEKGVIKEFIFTHLKSGLKHRDLIHTRLVPNNVANDEIQEKLSQIRTDLDKFSDYEVKALMYNAYKQIEEKIEVSQLKSIQNGEKYEWMFLKFEEDVKEGRDRVLNELDLAQYKLGRGLRKWWRSR